MISACGAEAAAQTYMENKQGKFCSAPESRLNATYYSINGDSRKYGWRVRSPGNIPDSCMQVEDKQRWTEQKKRSYFGKSVVKKLVTYAGVHCCHSASSRMKCVTQKHRKWSVSVLLYSLIPDLDGPVRTAGDENTRVEVVPLDGVHRHVVSIVGLQQLLGVGFGALREQLINLR